MKIRNFGPFIVIKHRIKHEHKLSRKTLPQIHHKIAASISIKILCFVTQPNIHSIPLNLFDATLPTDCNRVQYKYVLRKSYLSIGITIYNIPRKYIIT